MQSGPPQRRPNGQLLPGFSGNPSGRPPVVREVQKLARQHTAAAIARLVELVASADGRIALDATEQLFDRAWGKPLSTQQTDVRKLDVGAMYLAAMQAANGVDPGSSAKVIEGTNEDDGAADGSDEPLTDGAPGSASDEVDW
jgi:hypothetical protein